MIIESSVFLYKIQINSTVAIEIEFQTYISELFLFNSHKLFAFSQRGKKSLQLYKNTFKALN